MKRILTTWFLGGMVFLLNATEKEIVKSTLTEVTVYSQGAQMHHKASFNTKVGITEIIVEGISSYIDPQSIQVKAFGNVVILDSKFSTYYPQPTIKVAEDGVPLKIKKDIKLLEDSLKLLSFDMQEIQDEIDVLNASKSILANNGVIRGQGKVNDSLNLLKQAVDYYSIKMNELNKKLLALNKRKLDRTEKKRGMEERLQALLNYQNNGNYVAPENTNPIPRITVTVSSKELVSGKLNLSYVVSNAGWTPFYDLRSEATTGKLNLTYKAQVYQNTGLDWNDIKLNISTNNPNANKTKPELNPWYIDYNVYRQLSDKKSKMEYLDHPNAIPQAAFNAGFSLNSEMDKDAMTADQFTTVVHHLIATEFKIDLPYTIKSNNEQHIVLIKQTELDTKFRYYTVPKLDPGVYLVAQMTKLDELQLVPAKANIYFDGSYIGETFIDPTTMDDTLNLSLGKDPNIIVKRTLLKKDSKERIIGDRKERSFAYNIEVKNLKSSNIDLVVQDQLPITQNADITIESLELSKGKLDEISGLVEWTMNLKAKETKTFDFNFKIKHAKDKNINIY
jgi:uncharacterized protein (TIGR02231 family)